VHREAKVRKDRRRSGVGNASGLPGGGSVHVRRTGTIAPARRPSARECRWKRPWLVTAVAAVCVSSGTSHAVWADRVRRRAACIAPELPDSPFCASSKPPGSELNVTFCCWPGAPDGSVTVRWRRPHLAVVNPLSCSCRRPRGGSGPAPRSRPHTVSADGPGSRGRSAAPRPRPGLERQQDRGAEVPVDPDRVQSGWSGIIPPHGVRAGI